MIYHNNAQLRDWLESAGGVHPSYGVGAERASFELDDETFSRVTAEILSAHHNMTLPQAQVRAARRMLLTERVPVGITLGERPTTVESSPPWRPASASKSERRSKLWFILKVIWAVLLLAGIWVVAARGDPGNAANVDAVVASLIVRRVLALPTGGIVLQLQNQGVTLATFGGGLVDLNCSTNMSCSFSGTTFTMTASSTASTAWSALTAGTNTNVGTFAATGNTWDFSGATLFKTPWLASGTLPGTSGQLLFNNAGAIGAEDPVVTPKTACGTTVFNVPLQQVPTVNTTATTTTTCLEVVTLNNQNSSAVTVNLTDNQGTPVANLTSFQIMPNSLIIQPLYGIQFLSGIRWVASTTGVTGAMFGFQ